MGHLNRERVKDVFAEAAERHGHDRDQFLAHACGGDPGLLAEVAALLAASEQTGALLGGADISAASPPPSAEGPGTKVGRYKLLQQIGEGGFGIVYMAEQEHPVRRKVALKVIKLGMDTRQVIARFEAERQALAMMDHPNVARVYDAGSTDAGRPYFVMELVKGVPVTEYCDRQKLPLTRRLELFLQVCHAVQHAHQKGLIHRDLKPSNVLVSTQDDRPLAKVIDFGIAKATQTRLTERTLFTEFRQLIGTPEYMSPEQAEGSLDLDTRSDVYSLGVLLYELLAGSPPFTALELRSKAFAEMQRIIREVEPPAPSTRLSASATLPALAADRGVQPRSLPALVRGDLDWVVMKCLEKDRTRRYGSASELAADVSRYLSDDPVTAGAPSRAYRLRKLVRRNKGPVAAAAAILLALAAGTVGTAIGLVGQSRLRAEAEGQRDEARRQAAIAQAVSQFQKDMLAAADPNQMMGDQVTVLQAVTAAVAQLDAGKLQDQSLAESGVRDTAGSTLLWLGRMDEAEVQLRKALDLRRRHLPPGHVDIGWSAATLAQAYHESGDYGRAEALYREALDIRRKALPAGDPLIGRSLLHLATMRKVAGDLSAAEALAREALAIYRKSAPNDPEAAAAVNRLAEVLQIAGRFAESEQLYREALAMNRRLRPAGHAVTASNLVMLGSLLRMRGRPPEEIEPLAREALEAMQKSLPPGHTKSATALNLLGLALLSRNDPAEAESVFRQALEIDRKALPPTHPRLGMSMTNLATALQDQRKFDEAERLHRDVLTLHRRSPTPNPLVVAKALNNLAGVIQLQGRLAEATPLFRESLDLYRATLQPGHPQIANISFNLGQTLAAQGQHAAAVELLRDVVKIRRARLPEGRPDLSEALCALANLMLRQGKTAEAESLLLEAESDGQPRAE